MKTKLSAKHQLAVKGLSECKASESNIRRIQVKDIVKEVEDYLKTYSSAGMDINWVDMMPSIENINTTTTSNVGQNGVDENLPQLLDSRGGPSDTRDTKIATLRLKFNAFKALEGEKLNGTYTRLICLLNDLENNRVFISQSESDSLAALYGKYHYEESLIDDIYESQTQRFTIQASSSKALVANNFQDSDSDVEKDNRSNNEFMADLIAEYQERA
ncbi:hypothetical protein Tco_1390516 [Tanacetum coccineum]